MSFTTYPAGTYPRWQFQPDVVAHATAMHAGAAEPTRRVAEAVGASPTSVRRWTAFTATLIDPAEALAVAARLDPETPHGLGAASRVVADGVRALAARVLDALESLGAALVRTGLALASHTGLGRLLTWQLATQGTVVPFKPQGLPASPRMALGASSEMCAFSPADERPRRPGRPAPAPGAPALPPHRGGPGSPSG